MPLKFSMESMEEVDPAVAGLYTEQEDGNFVLTGIDNIVHKSKLDGFRENNIELTNKLELYKDIDIDDIKATETKLKEANILLEKKGEIDDETINKIVESRLGVIQQEANDSKKDMQRVIDTQSKQLESLIIDGAVNTAASKHKISNDAKVDVMLRAKQIFKLIDGQPAARDVNNNKMYGDDGVSELSVSNWVKSLIKTSPHLFEDSVTGKILNQDRPGYKGDPSKLSASQKIHAGLG